MTDIAVRVTNLSKRYYIGQRQKYYTLRDSLVESLNSIVRGSIFRKRLESAEALWALRNVSLEIEHGAVIGIVGRNGAGKSTFLKILSRITEPTEGSIELHGRVGSLLEVGTGFNQELTGRENIFLNGAILGMKRTEIERKFDEIVEFAEVEKFIDTPVKRYSSGMYMRLAFSVAAHLEPEILLVDEVLAVGDISFQQRCLGKMGEVAGAGRTVLFVSHNLNAIWSLCPKTVWLDRGIVKAYGDTSQVMSDYRTSMRIANANTIRIDANNRSGTGRIRITDISLAGEGSQNSEVLSCGKPATLILDFVAEENLSNVEVNLLVVNEREVRLFALTNTILDQQFSNLPQSGKFICDIPKLPLLPGEYYLHFSCLVRGELADKALFATRFTVAEGDYYGTGKLPNRNISGDMLVDYDWRLEC